MVRAISFCPTSKIVKVYHFNWSMFRGDNKSELEFDMSRLETEQGCSSENNSSEPLVSAPFGSLPDTLASVAYGLDLAELDSSSSPSSSPVTSSETAKVESAPNSVAVTEIVAEVQTPLVASSNTAANSSSNSTSANQSKRPSRSGSPPKIVAPPRKPHQPRSAGIWGMLRSRRVRVMLTLVGVLMIAGLVGLNMRGSGTSTDIEDDELAMSEFGQGSSDQMTSGDSSMQEPAAFEDGFDNKSIVTANAEEWETSTPRLPPLGLPVMNDSNVVPASGVDRSSESGQRGAWLTGQIEVEPNGVVPASGFRSSFGGRR